MERFWSLLLLLILLLSLISTGLILGYGAIVATIQPYGWITFIAAFFLMGILAGATSQAVSPRFGSRVTTLLLTHALMYLYVVWLFPIVNGDIVTQPLGQATWGNTLSLTATSALGSFLVLVVGAMRERRDRHLTVAVKEENVLAFIKEHGLFVSEDTLVGLASGEAPYKCPFCRHEHTGEEFKNADWRYRFIRCTKNSDHIFHGFDAKKVGWRCPIDRSLLYLPRY